MSELFQSFFMGGFECATHRRRDRTQIDVIAQSRHDVCAAEDYRLLRQAGIRTVRDGLRWHLVESAPAVYDWSSFLPMLEASVATRTQVIWDLCHWGVPAWIDIFSPDFISHFAAFANAAARLIRERSNDVPFYCAINEISFWSWVGGDVETFYPHRTGNGYALKRQLVAASIAAIQAIRAIDPRARFVQPEPVINVVANSDDADAVARAIAQTESQFQTWDMLLGLQALELGGSPAMLDLLGVNFYWNNQWINDGDKTVLGHHHHRPLHVILRELWLRYRRPILITETGAEAGSGVGWLGYIAAEVRQAIREGVPVEALCLYPVMDYAGWDDERHCHCGLIGIDDAWNDRVLRSDLSSEIHAQQAAMQATMQWSLTPDAQSKPQPFDPADSDQVMQQLDLVVGQP